LFRSLWIAALVSSLGSWIQEVAAAWLMSSLTSSPFMVALVQAAATVPIFLLALAAGALADVVDRRRLLIATQAWMLAASALLGALTLLGVTTAPILLAGVALVGLGTALMAPAWQALIPELVERHELAAALALNGIAINLARAAGPAIGGAVVGWAGPGAAFLLNAASFLGVLAVLAAWRRPRRGSLLPAERLAGAVAAGLRYARHTPDLIAVTLRAAAFASCASALWALLPVLVRFEMRRGPSAYGMALACIGLGAVAGAFLLPRVRRVLEPAPLSAAATLVFGTALAALAAAPGMTLLCLATAAAGGAWIVLLTAFHAGAQTALAAWVRGRGLSVYFLAFFGAMTAGSAVWGAIAERFGARPALALAAIGAIVGLVATRRLRLPAGEGADLAPSRHWPAAVAADEPDAGRGPVLVTVEYRIDPARSAAFLDAMREVRRVRLRSGALRWDLLSDPREPGRFVESFLVESWIEHLRQHERLTAADRAAEAEARRHHVGAAPPDVSHFIAKDLPG
jgi:predicted MFS family arabinose efflux permease/quinol monooxygenase YgiN